MERTRANFKVRIELEVAAPKDLKRTALASPPWPINMELSGSREAIRVWERKTQKREKVQRWLPTLLPVCKAPCFS